MSVRALLALAHRIHWKRRGCIICQPPLFSRLLPDREDHISPVHTQCIKLGRNEGTGIAILNAMPHSPQSETTPKTAALSSTPRRQRRSRVDIKPEYNHGRSSRLHRSARDLAYATAIAARGDEESGGESAAEIDSGGTKSEAEEQDSDFCDRRPAKRLKRTQSIRNSGGGRPVTRRRRRPEAAAESPAAAKGPELTGKCSDDASIGTPGDGKTAASSNESEEDETACWVNTGATKEDDDRVVHEVKKRHAVARRIFATGTTSSEGKSKLELLLDQSNKYTAYMLAQSLAPYDGDYPDGERARPSAKRNGTARRRRRAARGDETEEMLLLQEADAELAGQQRFWTRLESQPASITGGTLKPYQLEGLNWLIHLYESGLNGILADEMGLGKTLQTIALLSYLKEHRNIAGPHLVLAPKSTLGNWFNETKRFCPSLKAYKFHGTKDERAEARAAGYLDPGAFDIIITSYELCIREYQLFKKFRFRYIVVDEAHRIKNEASKLSQIIRQFRSQFRLLLTGTPLQNNLRELWALLNFLFPEMFASGEEFDRLFDLTGSTEEAKGLTPDKKAARNAEIVSRLHKVLSPFLLRRVKADVMVELPPKKELLLCIPLSALQRTLYIDLLTRNVDAIHDVQGGGRVRLLNLAMQLRKACNHPYLFEGYEDKSLDPFGEHLVYNSGKVLMLDRLLQRLIPRGSRTVIFTQMTRVLDILEDYCRMRGFSYCRLDGSTLGDDRERQLEEFNAPGSPHSIFLLSTRAGGLGINLATADTVVLFDSDWNPQVDLQAMDRAHRIGQKNPVNVYRFIHQHTIEEKILERASLKLKLDTAVIQQGRLSEQQRQLGKAELLRMIQFGADQIFKSKDAAEMTDADVEAILSRGEERSQELSTRLESHLKKSLLNFDSSFGTAPSLYEFEGVDYEPQKDRQAWADMAVRVLEEERNTKRKARAAEVLQRQKLSLAAEADAAESRLRNKLLRLLRMEEWQFYQRDRIVALHDLEVQFVNGLGDEPTFEQREEKQRLLGEGFGDWTRKDFLAFIKGCETGGISNTAQLARDLGRSEPEVQRYASVFLERYKELAEGDKWLARVHLGDTAHAKRREVEEILTRKLSEETFPWRRGFMKFPKSKSHFTEEEDCWLLNTVRTVGYGDWENIQLATASDPTWTFDWFLRTRSPQDLARRADMLIRQIQRESQEDNDEEDDDTAPSETDEAGATTTSRGTAPSRMKTRTAAAAAAAAQKAAPRDPWSLYPRPEEMYGTSIVPLLPPFSSSVPQQKKKSNRAPRAKKQPMPKPSSDSVVAAAAEEPVVPASVSVVVAEPGMTDDVVAPDMPDDPMPPADAILNTDGAPPTITAVATAELTTTTPTTVNPVMTGHRSSTTPGGGVHHEPLHVGRPSSSPHDETARSPVMVAPSVTAAATG